MKKTFKVTCLVLLSISLLISCEKDDLVEKEDNNYVELADDSIDLESDLELVVVGSSDFNKEEADAFIEKMMSSTKYGTHPSDWTKNTHGVIAYYSARRAGLSTTRSNRLFNASDDPDYWDQGWDNLYWQQWSHAYLRDGLGVHIWGDADDDFEANVETAGSDSYEGSSAFDEYEVGDEVEGDIYLGYACHYLADACGVLHCSVPTYDMISNYGEHHYDYEEWVNNNLVGEDGHEFKDYLYDDGGTYYAINSTSDLKQAIRNVSYWSCYSKGDGKKLWDSYKAGDYKTGEGDYSSDSDCVTYTKAQLLRAKRYTIGMIKYALDANNAW